MMSPLAICFNLIETIRVNSVAEFEELISDNSSGKN